MRSWDALPDHVLRPLGPVTEDFAALGVATIRSAGRYLQELPYGRTVDRADFRAVIAEGRGTCSTKHALMASLAAEQGLPLQLTLGVYLMSEANTHGVGLVLDPYGLDAAPEAHCYLIYRGVRIDVTRATRDSAEPIGVFTFEEPIEPEQIGPYKLEVHKRAIRDWLENDPSCPRRMSFEEVWAIREACIAALGQ
jgi:hypothetical protein